MSRKHLHATPTLARAALKGDAPCAEGSARGGGAGTAPAERASASPWSDAETRRFYAALREHGANYELLGRALHRSSREVRAGHTAPSRGPLSRPASAPPLFGTTGAEEAQAREEGKPARGREAGGPPDGGAGAGELVTRPAACCWQGQPHGSLAGVLARRILQQNSPRRIAKSKKLISSPNFRVGGVDTREYAGRDIIETRPRVSAAHLEHLECNQ